MSQAWSGTNGKASRIPRTIGWLTVSLAIVISVVVGCETASDDVTGGETHFLRRCVAEDNSCGASLSCVCGACTVPCESQASCASFPAAQCTLSNVGSCAAGAVAVCRVACAFDSDCAVLSDEHRCVDGSCLAGVAPAGTGGASGELPTGSGGGTAGEPSTCEKGLVLPNEVLVLGDSFLATSHQITAFLEAAARDAQALSVGDRYRDSSRIVANALALSGNGIADQYESAAADTSVKVAIMNGGGADILLGSCDPVDADCPVVVAAAAAFSDLLETMAEDGVRDVLFVGYPDPVPEAARAKMDALRPLLESGCAASPVPCHWIDLRPVFSGHYDEYILSDGLNPSEAGSKAAATAIWAVMQDECIAQ